MKKKKPEDDFIDDEPVTDYDSDFIDDGGEDATNINYSKHIRSIFGYDKRQWVKTNRSLITL